MKKNLVTLSLILSILVSTTTTTTVTSTAAATATPKATNAAATATPQPTAKSTAKPYGDSLKLNNNIKLGKKKKFTKTGIIGDEEDIILLFGKKVKDIFFVWEEKVKEKVQYEIETSKRKSSGKNIR